MLRKRTVSEFKDPRKSPLLETLGYLRALNLARKVGSRDTGDSCVELADPEDPETDVKENTLTLA